MRTTVHVASSVLRMPAVLGAVWPLLACRVLGLSAPVDHAKSDELPRSFSSIQQPAEAVLSRGRAVRGIAFHTEPVISHRCDVQAADSLHA